MKRISNAPLEIPVTLKDKGRSKRVSTQWALFMRLRERAFTDNHRALETYLGMAKAHNGDEAPDRFGDEKVPLEDQAILEAYAEEVRSRPAAGAEPTPDASQTGEDDGGE